MPTPPTFAVWGSNTGVGKTLVSAGLARAAAAAARRVLYLKPVQTGLPRDSDGALVALLFGCRQRLVILAAYVVQDLRELLVLSRRSSDDAASIAEVRLLALLAHLVPSLTTNISIVKKLIIWIENGCSRRPARHKS